MKNNQTDFDVEFNDKIIRVLNDNKKDFVTNWNENEAELKEKISVLWDTKISDFGHKLLTIIAVISIIYLLILCFFGLDWFIADGASAGDKFKNYLTVFVIYFVSVLVLMLHEQSKNKGASLFHVKDDKKSLIDFDSNKTNGIFSRFNTFLQDAQEVVCNTIPTYKEINESQRHKEKLYVECYKVGKAAKYFNVKKLENGIVDFANNSINQCEGSDEITIRKSIIAHVCTQTFCDATLVNLLVSYYYGENNDVETHWKIIKNDKRLLNQISHIVWKLNIFNLYENSDGRDEELNEDDLRLILSMTQKFEQPLIINNVLLYIRIYKFLLNYREKLAKEKINENINLKKQLTKKEIIDNIDFNDDFVPNFINVFSQELRESLDIDPKDAYVDALIAITLSQDINFRETVCRNAYDNDEAIYVLMAYHDLREQKGKKNEHFSLYDIFNSDYTPAKMKEKINTDHFSQIKFKRFSSALYEGKWIESTQMILLSMIDNVEQQLIKSERNEMVIQIFAKYFTNININTLDRAVDAGLFTIYLILVPQTEGSFLRGVIDKLSVQKNKHMNKNDGTRFNFNYDNIRKTEERYNIMMFFDLDADFYKRNIPMYDFDNYSKAARIGIVNSEISFTTFVDRFNKDVERVLRKEINENPSQEWEKITFILLRISPSKYSFGLMDDKINIEGVKSFGNLDLVEKIATLASPYLTELQKTAVATFENDIRLENILEELTLFDLMPLNTKKIYGKKYGKLLKSQNLMVSVKECLKMYNLESFRELSNSLYYRSKIQSELKKSLTSIIAKENIKLENPPLNEEIQDEFVSEFLASIKSLYDLWNHELLKL